MGRAGDFSRVVKGAGKVAQALLDAEAPAAAQRLLRIREHGVGLACSLKDAVSSATSSAAQRGPLPSDSSSKTSTHVAPPLRVTSASNVRDPAVSPSTVTNGNVAGFAATEMPTTTTQDFRSQQGTLPKEQPSLLPLSATEKETVEDPKKADGAKQEIEALAGVLRAEAEATTIPAATGESSGAETVSLKVATGSRVADESEAWPFAEASTAADSAGTSAKNGDGSDGGVGRDGMINSRARTVPSSPLARVFGFGQLAAGLAMGTVAEAMRQSVAGGEGGSTGEKTGGRQGVNVKNYVVNDANAERLAETLCRMRGAALKLGQMLSIQDESVIPPSLAKALDRVRQGADIMPLNQLHRQLEKSFGRDWRNKLSSFDETPIAAASIGQVHRARLLDGTEVAMKIQYPGVADSVESDLRNLQLLVKLTNILPPGLYIDEIIKVGREELSEECDYEKEAAHQERFRKLVESDEHLRKWASVPRVVPELLSKEVLTTHLAPGVPVDQIMDVPQEVRDHVARLMLRCTVKELFEWRFMQTDPNWGNFLFDRATGKMTLIDFGACREYKKEFVDGYFRLVWAAANRDEDTILEVSQKLKFLTGDESQSMMGAHVKAGLVVGEPFIDRGRGGELFDFNGSNITARLSQHGDTFMKHRLTPPPREAYSLHRKLAGAFLMNIKLKAVIPCRDILEEVHDRYVFG